MISYVPCDAVIGRHTFLAIEDSDFQEDTKVGKGTLYAALTTIYQCLDNNYISPSLKFNENTRDKTLPELPDQMKNLPVCNMQPNCKPPS